MLSRRCAGVVLPTVLLLLLTACSQVPITGRNRLMLISLERETQIGAQAFSEFMQEARESSDARLTAMVQRVGARIAEKVHAGDAQWEFKLIESDQVNAFALPGGKIVVYRGILQMCGDEAGLAAIIGHEAGHVLARHGGERMSIGLAVSLVLAGTETATRGMSAQQSTAILAALGMGAKVGVSLPYSRVHEYEADSIGTRLMARAGYDPSASWQLWERMAAAHANAPMEFLSTHPASAKRMQALKEMMPEMQQLYERAPAKYGRGEGLETGN